VEWRREKLGQTYCEGGQLGVVTSLESDDLVTTGRWVNSFQDNVALLLRVLKTVWHGAIS
jgi:hypothetical protein